MFVALNRRQEQPPTLETFDVKPLIGPLFVGSWLTWMLLGTMTVQVYWYNNRYPDDRKALKTLVYSLLFIDILQTVVITWSTWDFAIAPWGDLDALFHPPPHIVTVPMFSSIVGIIVQTFYAWRIWTVGKHPYFRVTAVVIVCIAVVQITTCFIGSIWFAVVDDVALLHSLRWSFASWLAASFSCDSLITISMLIIFNNAKERRTRTLAGATTSSSVDTLIDRLIRQTVETGAIITLFTGVEFILFLWDDQVNYHIAPAYVLGKLYTNCLVAMLNSRKPGQGWGSTATSSSHAQSTGSNQKQQQGSNTFSSACGYQLNDMSNTARRFTGNTVDRYQDTSANSKRNSNPYSDADQAILRIQVAKETVSDGLQRDVGGKSFLDVSQGNNNTGANTRASSDTELESISSQKVPRTL